MDSYRDLPKYESDVKNEDFITRLQVAALDSRVVLVEMRLR